MKIFLFPASFFVSNKTTQQYQPWQRLAGNEKEMRQKLRDFVAVFRNGVARSSVAERRDPN